LARIVASDRPAAGIAAAPFNRSRRASMDIFSLDAWIDPRSDMGTL
jgi:hypothetical protein